jgi:hypothetical protein
VKAPFVAWIVRDSDEEHAEVVAARNVMEARRLGADEVNNGEFESCTAERAPEYDALLGDSDALRYKQLEDGWWFGCNYADCGNERVSYDCDDYDEGGKLVEPDPFVRHGDVYCSAWCAGAEAVRHVDKRIRIWEAIEWAVATFPGASIDDVWPDTFEWREAGKPGEPRVSSNRIVATVWLFVPQQFKIRFGWQVGQAEQDMDAVAAAEWNEYRAWRESQCAEGRSPVEAA